jgi:hypothetical protein
MATSKLRKPSPASPKKYVHGSLAYGQNGVMTTTSRTMMMAQASAHVPYSWSTSSRKSTEEDISSSRSTRREFVGPQPTTSAAQYWAARAVTAEALLSARESHHMEIRSLSLAEDVKRKVSASSTIIQMACLELATSARFRPSRKNTASGMRDWNGWW